MNSINVLASTLSLQAVASKREGGLGPQLTYMKIIIEQLDGRFKGRRFWSHRAEFRYDWTPGSRQITFQRFIEARTQLWETYGPGCDRDEVYHIKQATQTTPEWGWWLDPSSSDRPYIYFRNGPILTWFLMQV